MEKLLVVLNPIAGARKKINLEEKLREWLGSFFDIQFQYWESADFDITQAVKERILNEHFDYVVAAGGDGTVNRTARALVNTNAVFSILPLGSGNGLARHFKIPMNLEKAAKVILNGKTVKMDSCLINNENFFCTAGTGFDAHIGHLFATAGKRGFKTYTKIVTSEFKSYKSSTYTITIDGKTIERKAFLITVANANQYGNNVFVAPEADTSDGLMNVVILKPFSLIHAPALAGRLFFKNFHKAFKTENFTGKEVRIIREKEAPVHYDGEPAILGSELIFNILPSSLYIRIPNKKG